MIIKEDLNLGNLLTNVIKNSENIEEKNTHIMSNISSSEVLAMSDDSHTLKIFTEENDIVNLNLIHSDAQWKQVSSNNSEGFSTYVSLADETIKLLIDETRVESI